MLMFPKYKYWKYLYGICAASIFLPNFKMGPTFISYGHLINDILVHYFYKIIFHLRNGLYEYSLLRINTRLICILLLIQCEIRTH